MNVLFVVPYLPSLIRVRPYHFIRELSKAGHEVTVLAANLGGKEPDDGDLRSLTKSLEIVPIPMSSSLQSCISAALHGEPLQSAVCAAPPLDRSLTTLIDTGYFDVVHIEHLRAARLARRLPREMPRLYDAVDSISLLLERTLRSSHSPRQRAVALLELTRTRAFEGRILAEFDRTIVTSSDDAALLQRLAPAARVRVVPNGVDQEYFQPLDGQRKKATLVFSGKMSYHANVTAILHFVRDIFPRIRRDHPDVRLAIVGSGPPRAVTDLASDPSISVTGHVPDVRPYVGRATVAVCPMVVKVGIQNKLLEAMAMATPTVSSRIGAMGLDATPGRDFLVADTSAEFAQHVSDVLSNSARAKSIGRAGKAYVEQHHSWTTAAGTLADLYREAITTRSITASATA